MLVVDQRAVLRTLDMSTCITLMSETLRELADGSALLPLRRYLQLGEGNGSLGMMPTYLPARKVIGIKVITVIPRNHGSQYDSHQGSVLLFEPEHGSLVATVDATAITAIRTAAVSGVATRCLAQSAADDLAIIGSGTEASTHLDAMLRVRPIRRVRVWSRNLARARTFAERAGARHNVSIATCETAESAVTGASIICTTTAASDPVVCGEWLNPGTHINAVGSSVATDRELDTAAVAKATLFVDRRESAMHEAGDFLIPCHQGAIGPSHIAGELSEVLAGRHPGRRSDDEITIFKSVGLGAEDVAAAWYVYAECRRLGFGTEVDFGGYRPEALDVAAQVPVLELRP
jgi:alanine dehydrogenase